MRYLDCNLTVTKMYNDYCTYNPKSNIWYNRYYTQFITNHNLKFKLPTTDICNTCYLLNNQIRASSTTTKNTLVSELTTHLNNGNKFYDLIKESQLSIDPYFLCASFDMQKILDLPKTPMNISYYSRKINFYNFGMKQIKLNSQSSYFYVWTEYDGARGSDEIMSMVLNFINFKIDKVSINSFRFFCDSCPGQNKNKNLLALLYYISQKKNIALEFIFPDRGHSFLASDRAFGCAERKFRKKETIILPKDYIDVLKSLGIVYKMTMILFFLMLLQ